MTDKLTKDKFTIRAEQDLKSLEQWLNKKWFDETLTTEGKDGTRAILLLYKGKRHGVVVVEEGALTGEVAYGKLTELLYIAKWRAG